MKKLAIMVTLALTVLSVGAMAISTALPISAQSNASESGPSNQTISGGSATEDINATSASVDGDESGQISKRRGS